MAYARVGIWSLILLVASASHVFANNGTQLTGYGAKAQGMGGVSLAFPQDSIAAANNPAGMAFVGSRFDLGAQVLYVSSESSYRGLENKGTGLAIAPELGFNYLHRFFVVWPEILSRYLELLLNVEMGFNRDSKSSAVC